MSSRAADKVLSRGRDFPTSERASGRRGLLQRTRWPFERTSEQADDVLRRRHHGISSKRASERASEQANSILSREGDVERASEQASKQACKRADNVLSRRRHFFSCERVSGRCPLERTRCPLMKASKRTTSLERERCPLEQAAKSADDAPSRGRGVLSREQAGDVLSRG